MKFKLRQYSLTILTAFFCLTFAAQTLSAAEFSELESEIFLNAHHRFTTKITRGRIEQLPDLQLFENKKLRQLILELNRCGVTSMDTACPDSAFTATPAIFSFKIPEQTGYRYLLKAIKKERDPVWGFMQVMRIVAIDQTIKVEAIELFNLEEIKLTQETFSSFFDRFYKRPLSPLVSVQSSDHDFNTYSERASQAVSAKSFYHSLFLALSVAKSEEHFTTLKGLVTDNSSLIADLESTTYQELYLTLLQQPKLEQKEIAELIASQYLDSTNQRVTYKAAILLASMELSGPRIKALLRSLLKTSNDIDLKLAGVRSLAKIKNDLNDDELLIGLVADPIAEISQAAFESMKEEKLINDHIPLILPLLNILNVKVKQYAAYLLNNIDSKKATERLIALLGDIDSNFAKGIFEFLKDRVIQANLETNLIDILESKLSHTKIYSMQLLASSKTTASILATLPLLKSFDRNVAATAFGINKEKDFTQIARHHIEDLLRSNRSEVYALKLLNKYPDADVNYIYTKKMRWADDKLGKLIYELLKSRDFNGNEMKYLERTVIFNRSEDVQIYAIKLMTKVPTRNTLSFLKKRLRRERHEPVKETLKKLINYIEELL